MDSLLNWITQGKVTPGGLISAIILYCIVLWIKRRFEIGRDRLNNREARRVQIESYFKQIGGSEQKDIYEKWMDLIINLDEASKKYTTTSQFQELKEKTALYGSDETVKILSSYAHYIYNENEKTSVDEETYTSMVYFAWIAASLKEDFTGYHLDPLILLRLQYKDFDQIKDKLKEAKKKIEDDIKWDWDK